MSLRSKILANIVPLVLSLLARLVVSQPPRWRTGIVGGDEVLPHSLPFQVSLQVGLSLQAYLTR